jgi:hypothetical protein
MQEDYESILDGWIVVMTDASDEWETRTKGLMETLAKPRNICHVARPLASYKLDGRVATTGSGCSFQD